MAPPKLATSQGLKCKYFILRGQSVILRKVSKYVIFELRNLWIFLTKPPTRPMLGQWLVTNLASLVTLEQAIKLKIGLKRFFLAPTHAWPVVLVAWRASNCQDDVSMMM